MKWWVSDGEVIGAAIAGVEPANFEIVEGVEAGDRDLVYFNGKTVELKPEKPQADAVWDVEKKAWAIPDVLIQEPGGAMPPDFTKLEGLIRNTPVWFRAWNSAKTTTRANAAFTLLLNSLTTNHNLADLRFSFNELRSAMDEQSSLSDFTAEELDYVTESLATSGFDLDGFNLEAS